MVSPPPKPFQVDASIAATPGDLALVPSLISDISGLGATASSYADDAGRLQLLAKTRALPAAFSSVNFGVEVGLWTLMAKYGDSAMKVVDLASELEVDPALLTRFMRHLGAMGYLLEVAADEYKSTNFSKALSLPPIGDGYPAMGGLSWDPMIHFHVYTRTYGKKMPTTEQETPFQFVHQTKLTPFEFLLSKSPLGLQFNNFMAGANQGRDSWTDTSVFPVQERLIEGFQASRDAVLLVDVGGGFGHDLQKFHLRFPSAPGRLVLQDLPAVIDQIQDLEDVIERSAHDFLTEQPIKGARAYYLHSILHDWPDEQCGTILAKLRDAMTPGYSKLLINENVIPATGADWEATALDIIMTTVFCSKERTRQDWDSIVEKAGLKVVKVWSSANSGVSLIECELA